MSAVEFLIQTKTQGWSQWQSGSVCAHCVENQQLTLQKNMWLFLFISNMMMYYVLIKKSLTAQLFCRHLSRCEVIQTTVTQYALLPLVLLKIKMSKWLLYSAGIMRNLWKKIKITISRVFLILLLSNFSIKSQLVVIPLALVLIDCVMLVGNRRKLSNPERWPDKGHKWCFTAPLWKIQHRQSL